jgi:xanthine dehydrogenase large subunit
LFANGGWSLDLSQPICDRAMFHHDNAYYVPAMEVTGRVGEDQPRVEHSLPRLRRSAGNARHGGDHRSRRAPLRLSPEVVRERNLYHGSGETNTTHYGQEIGDNRLERIWQELKANARDTSSAGQK